MPATTHILGIRHHGPGSARSVIRALDELQPQCVLIEGPPDADELIPHVAHAQMEPPVAILVHDVAEPARAAYYPFATFSPEWQAMRWAVAHGVPVRFMDLPQSQRIALVAERVDALKAKLEAASKADGESEHASEESTYAPTPAPLPPVVELDPLQRLAEAAGFEDGERWWEHVVESRRSEGAALFAAIREAMAELRATRGDNVAVDPDEPYREAWMRRTMREAVKEGHETIAVVCGAWHAPALDLDAHPKKADDELLKPLTKVKTAATWVPWTYDRLAYASGYGAGIHSPGWYEHLWHHGDGDVVLESWMTRVARTLRGRDIDCSSAHVIEAVRLATSLATIRGRPLADLSDIADATRSIFCFDSDLAMRLIGRELLVGIRIGNVPDDVPAVPLQQDLNRLQKRLRLKPEAQERALDLDLRNDTDRERSILLHRLRLLGIDWGEPTSSNSKGTFRESWTLRWEPEFAVKLIVAGALGNTVEAASGARLAQIAAETLDLKGLTARLQDAMLADLGDAARVLVRQIESVAAIAADVAMLMDALPPLANLLRYGNVRDTDATTVRDIVDGIVPRIAVGLGGGVASLNDDAADEYDKRIRATDAAIALIEVDEHTAAWRDAMARVVDQPSVHGLIRGVCARLLLDANRFDTDAVALRLGQTLSRGNDPAQGARWLEGFLRGSGLLLIHDPKLLGLIDAWVADISDDGFQELLPLLRRTFATFAGAERRQIGTAVRTPTTSRAVASATTDLSLDRDRAERPLALVTLLLGGQP